MVKLKNKHLTVRIDPVGAEIKSITVDGTEKLWQGEEDSWNRTAPTLFPFCGGLKDGKFTYKTEEYVCEKHGFAKDAKFAVEEKTKRQAVLRLKSDEETKKNYPFDFEFLVTFSLNKQSLIVKYDIKNTGKEEMYFSVGSHESYFCAGGIENYEILFPRRESLENCVVEQGLIGDKTEQITNLSKTLSLYEKYFSKDSLVFKNMISRSLVLRNRISGERIKIEFPGCDYFVIWTIPGKEYVCLEPWAGFPDLLSSGGKIEEKTGIIKLRKKGRKTIAHKITFLPAL